MVAARQAWPALRAEQPAGMRRVFLDECGVTTRLTREHGRAPAGERVAGHAPRNHRHVTSVLGEDGLLAVCAVEGACDADVFRTWLAEGLGPLLRPGDLVILDSLSVHKAADAAACLAPFGARAAYLPPYSPDPDPIEKCWSKRKARLRAAKARTQEALDVALAEAIRAVRPSDAQGWFASCGYRLQES